MPLVARVLFPLSALVGVALAVIAAASIGSPVERVSLLIGLPELPMHVRLDALSCVFLFLLGAASAGISIFSAGYFRKGQGTAPGLQCLQYHLFLAAMGFVLVADDAYGFMVAWETMALSSYFLVTAQHGLPEIRRAGFLYVVIAHVGALSILLSFGVMQGGTWQFTFDAMRAAHLSPGWAAAAFGLALAGFGAKAGLLPLHVWLPEAHPAAPSPVSALMSGIMLKTAVYGILRVTFDLLGEPLWWWGLIPVSLGTGNGALRRGVRGGTDGHETAARVLVDREHRHPVHGTRPRRRLSRRRHAGAFGAGTDGSALPRHQPRVHEEPVVPRHGCGAARDWRAQPGPARRADPSHAVGRLAHAGGRTGDRGTAAAERVRLQSGCCCSLSCSRSRSRTRS